MTRHPLDDLGAPVRVSGTVRRVVSLVPSLTEALATVDADALVGATDWCTRPTDLDALRVRGTKNPDLRAIVGLAPDLVVANREENRALDVRRLREAGVPVWVTDIETVPGAVAAMTRLFDEALGWPQPDWLAAARRLWCGDLPAVTRRIAIAIWRDPWMVVGARTFTSDLVRRLGWENAWADPAHNPAGRRYPRVDAWTVDAAGLDAVLLPDEPYAFTDRDGPEAFSLTPTELVDGRLLTWYGPALLEAVALIQR